jgi:hypothetical protein
MPAKKNKIMCEFFSGSKNVSNVFKSKAWSVVTLDINQKLNPSICIDILKLEREHLPRSVAFLWFSPVCETFSRAASQSNWKKETLKYRVYDYVPLTEKAKRSIDFLKKVKEIISWFPDVPFIIENPIGRIHHMPDMKTLGHYRYFVNYFNYGFPYSKETYLFSNCWLPFSTKKEKVTAPGLRTINSVYHRSEVPAALIETIFNYLFCYENSI